MGDHSLKYGCSTRPRALSKVWCGGWSKGSLEFRFGPNFGLETWSLDQAEQIIQTDFARIKRFPLTNFSYLIQCCSTKSIPGPYHTWLIIANPFLTPALLWTIFLTGMCSITSLANLSVYRWLSIHNQVLLEMISQPPHSHHKQWTGIFWYCCLFSCFRIALCWLFPVLVFCLFNTCSLVYHHGFGQEGILDLLGGNYYSGPGYRYNVRKCFFVSLTRKIIFMEKSLSP